MSQVLYRKWRPQTLAEVAGQDHVTHTLLNALKAERVSHAYLFCGPRGTGKTSTGRILAKAVNCLEGGQGEPCNECTLCREVTEGHAMDVMEIDAASNRGIDEIRELRERARFAPSVAKYKIYVIDEVHMLTEPAANALLKTLEEPPPHVLFVLATTEPHKVPLTILSRCQRFDFRRIPLDAMVARLAVIAEGEGIHIDDASLKLIARSATGSMRDAINLLEQLSAHYGNEVSLNHVQAMLGITGDARAREVARHIVEGDIHAGIHTINSVTQDGVDLRQFNRELVEYLRGLLLIKAGAPDAVDLPQETVSEMEVLAERATMPQLSAAVRLFREVEANFDGFSPLPLELALVECTLPVDRHEMLEKLERATEQPEEEPATPTKPSRAKKVEEPIERPTPKKAEKAPPEEEAAVSDETEAPASAPQPAAAATPVDTELEKLRARWKEVVDATKGMGSKGNLDALLRSACEPIEVADDTLVLGFYYDFHKEKIEDPKYRTMVESKVNEIFGRPYKIRCQLIERKAKDKGHLIDAALRMGARILEDEEEA